MISQYFFQYFRDDCFYLGCMELKKPWQLQSCRAEIAAAEPLDKAAKDEDPQGDAKDLNMWKSGVKISGSVNQPIKLIVLYNKLVYNGHKISSYFIKIIGWFQILVEKELPSSWGRIILI